MNSKVAVLFLIILGLLLSAMLLRNGDLAWMALPFLFYLVTGILQAPDPGVVQLQASRQVSKSDSQGPATIDVEVTVSNQGTALGSLFLADPLLEGMKITDGQPCQRMPVRSGEEIALTYSFEAKRGRYDWKTIQAVASDPFGLIELKYTLPAQADLYVQPPHERFNRLALRPRTTLHAPGSIPARLGGRGTDFWGVREYHPGDSLRWLDWRLTARHPGKFFTKEFEQEEIADIGLILDARERTDLRIGESSLFEHALSATASLAEVFLHQGHRVSLLALTDTMVWVFPGYGKIQLNRIMRVLSRIQSGANEMINSLDYLPLRMFSSHALLLVLSPLVSSDWPFFPRLRSHGYQALLVSPDPFDFMRQAYPSGKAHELAFRAARLERCLQLRDIAQLQIPVIDWQVSRPLYPLVSHAIGRARGQREM